MIERFEQMWLVTMKMAVDIKKRGFKIDKTFNSLRSARVILHQCMVDPHAKGETLSRAGELIDSAQRDIFLTAQPLGKEFTEKWEGEIRKVMKGEILDKFSVARSKFYANLPRGKKWARLKIPPGLDAKKLKDIARSCEVTITQQEKRYILISGEKESMRKALDVISGYLS